ncbi:MAG: cytochrome c [Anaerolineae bacterium]|nr:cytochrome c [Anaerolineae bacterium]
MGLYEFSLVLHNLTRWLVVVVMLVAIGRAWWGVWRGSAWTTLDRRLAWAFAMLMSVQFIWGAVLFLVPDGLAQAAVRDMSASMKVRELRFFGLEHPLQMVIALGLVHLGAARSRKANADRTRFRWVAGTFTLATVLVLSAIPWWRPLVRSVTVANAPIASVSFSEAQPDLVGDAMRGEELFGQSVGGLPSCATCHLIGEGRLIGPGLAGIAQTATTRATGQTARQYLHDSIIAPSQVIVEGYPNVMPAQFGTVLTMQQVEDLVAYLLTLNR